MNPKLKWGLWIFFGIVVFAPPLAITLTHLAQDLLAQIVQSWSEYGEGVSK